jgi:hexosaminidase
MIIGRELPRPVLRLAPGEQPGANAIHVALAGDASLGDEGYALQVQGDRALLTATSGAGLFHGTQTIRQLLPWAVEHRGAIGRKLALPALRIVDRPRFAWRGAMLDVARHFRTVDEVKRYIDALALYKINRLHLHLADDQGWRIEIKSWPDLARIGGSTQVGGAGGGYYTQEQYADLVAYAAARYVTIVPEIDMPGHTNAALASYPVLNCNDQAPPLYTGTRVGFSALCVTRDTTYAFVRDVVSEVGALTPGPWFHMGGDEVEKLTHVQYRDFVARVDSIVRAAGKVTIGWGEISPAAIDPTTIVQHWRRDSAIVHVARGGRMIMSPGSRMYLDMKYDSATVLGLRWAGLVSVRTSYDWDPATLTAGIGEPSILGVEAPLWAETLARYSDVEFMAFPRIAAVAEVGWTAQSSRGWDDFRARLAAHGPRLRALGINFYPSPEIDWFVQ